ncbi:MAG: TaqI-like C-terminal specificity domain-containing protein [Bacteroidota bacterium]|nr:TaqI-like C-terminal specificity domain-containing protein [Bacteroidota bacterium]
MSLQLKGQVFFYKSPRQTNTSFYVVTIPLEGKDLYELKRFIWNQNEYDLFFLAEKPESNLLYTLFYAKASPKDTDTKIASFSGDENNLQEIEKINRWNFVSGAFWLAYSDFVEKIKNKGRIDSKLVEQLKELKHRLVKEFKNKPEIQNSVVQALIDRTLFLKFLEDNHIINSYFYDFYFPKRFSKNNTDFGFKALLREHDVENINKLFSIINKLFNNVLFKTPVIDPEFLTNNVLHLIYLAISQHNWKDGQLSLFDFRFDVIPIEFISHIYEVFLESNQLNEGIYYTPDKLAHLIIDDTISGLGTVLDPSCGSGMFLVLAFRKLLEYIPNEPEKANEKIEQRNKILNDYIFGIEKENTAWRLTILSLYLELLKDIPSEEIKLYIRHKLDNNSETPIFPYDFSANIINWNALETKTGQQPHKDKTFTYIVGNPPFFEIKADNEEVTFVNEFKKDLNGIKVKAKEVVGHKQISQAFMLKLKDWSSPETHFGFVQNSSNFYNEKSANFQNFFFTYYQVERFYELSRVKDILFRKAKESVVVTIFNNKQAGDNSIEYYPVEMGLFSKTFDLLIIQEDKKIKISQQDILDNKVVLRDYLIGNEHDLRLLRKLSKNRKLEEFLLKDKKYNSFRGLERATNLTVANFSGINSVDFNKLPKSEKLELQNSFSKTNYLSDVKTEYFNTPFIYNSENISSFSVEFEGYMNVNDIAKDFFQRIRNKSIYKSDKILFGRYGNRIEAAYIDYDAIFSTRIYSLKLHSHSFYNLFTAIINSELINYFVSQKYRKRVDGNFSKLDTDAIKNIPIPTDLDEELAFEISKISKELTQGKLKYEGETKEKLNDLIYELYELNVLEKNRIKHFFEKDRIATESDLEKYSTSLNQSIDLFFEDKPIIQHYTGENYGFGLVVVALYFNGAEKKQPTSKKTLQYLISNKILKSTGEKFLTMREIMIGNNCIYIVKNNSLKSWTTTKAFEDGQEILKRLIV